MGLLKPKYAVVIQYILVIAFGLSFARLIPNFHASEMDTAVNGSDNEDIVVIVDPVCFEWYIMDV